MRSAMRLLRGVLTAFVLCLAAHVAVANVTITNSGSTWAPPNVTILPGETVTWNWTGFHNVAQTNSPASFVWNGTGFRSGNPTIGGSYSHLFPTPGVHYFTCEVHGAMGMRGSVTVLDPCADPTPPATHVAIAYNPASDTVTLSWDPVMTSIEGCPLAPDYHIYAGSTPTTMVEITSTPGLSLELPAVGQACYAVTVNPSSPAN